MRNVHPRDLGNRRRRTLAVWGFKEGGLLQLEASRKLDSKCFLNSGQWTSGVWVTKEGGVYGFNALATNEKRIPNEFPRGSHSSTRF